MWTIPRSEASTTNSEVHTAVRKLITTLPAASALAVPVMALTSAADPTDAQAAECQRWRLGNDLRISQSNGVTVRMGYYRQDRQPPSLSYSGSIPYTGWYAVGYRRPASNLVSSYVRFTDWSSDLVKFVITWRDGAEGVYTGTISEDGHVTGTTVDRWSRSNRAHWDMGYRSCLRYG